MAEAVSAATATSAGTADLVVAAVVAQRYADRNRGAGGAVAAVAVIVIAAVLLTTEWFA